MATGTRPHFIDYCALVMGLQGRPWNDCQGVEKAALRLKFDGIKISLDNMSDFEKTLNRIGAVKIRSSNSPD